MFRFSLATFLIFVTLLALIVAGLAHPNAIWEQIIGTTTLLVLLAATIALISWQGAGRWFWVGFAVAGWAYWGMAFYGGQKGRSVLLTEFALEELDGALGTTTASPAPGGERVVIHRNRVIVSTNDRQWTMDWEEAAQSGLLKYAYSEKTVPTSTSFRDIGHYAWTLILGCLGGVLSLWLHRTSTTKAGAEGSSG